MISEFIKKVVISRRAYEDLVIYASRYASHLIDPNDQREVYGILVGRINKEKAIVVVRQAIGIVVGSRTGVEFENKQYVDLSNIDESIFKKSMEYETGDFICGWWHTHPGFGFFYSHTDILNHIGFQAANPYAIGLIYDYTQKKTAVNDPGLEALRLDKPEPMHALTEKINVEIEELGQSLTNLDHILDEKVKAVQAASKSIDYIRESLDKKRFAQIQRNYGLLLLKKNQKKLNSKELKQMSEEDRFMYEWNEADVKEKYIVPKFREQLEKEIANFQKHKDKRGQGQKQLEKTLLKPKKAVEEVYGEFNTLVEQMHPVRRWFDAEERLVVSNIAFKFEQYINILNALITKTYYLLPHDIDLDPQLFDEKVLGTVLYGNEDAATVDAKQIGDVQIQPITAEADTTSRTFEEQPIKLTDGQNSSQVKLTQEAAKALEQSIDNDLDDEEDEINSEKLPAKISIPKIDTSNTFVIPKIKTRDQKPAIKSLPEVEPVIKTRKGEIIADPELMPPKETPSETNKVSGNPIKVNIIQPIQIEMKPISINGHKNKLEIDFDEIFDDGWSDK